MSKNGHECKMNVRNLHEYEMRFFDILFGKNSLTPVFRISDPTVTKIQTPAMTMDYCLCFYFVVQNVIKKHVYFRVCRSRLF